MNVAMSIPLFLVVCRAYDSPERSAARHVAVQGRRRASQAVTTSCPAAAPAAMAAGASTMLGPATVKRYARPICVYARTLRLRRGPRPEGPDRVGLASWVGGPRGSHWS